MLSDWAALVISTSVSCLIHLVDRVIRASPPIHKLARWLSGGRNAAAQLPAMAAWDRVSNCIVRINGLNPGPHTLQGTNTYLVGRGEKRWLIDTGEGKKEYIDLLKSVMKEVKCTGLEGILLTHHHADHVGGVKSLIENFGEVPVYKQKPRQGFRELCSFLYSDIADGQVFKTIGATLVTIYTPGHTHDHASYYLKEEKALIGGDMVLGCGTAIFDDYASYISTLDAICSRCTPSRFSETESIHTIHPGHGPDIEEAKEWVNYYIDHRLKREEQIMEYFNSSNNCSSKSSLQVTIALYGKLSIPLLIAAHHNVLLHISKLVKEKKIVQSCFVPCCYRSAVAS